MSKNRNKNKFLKNFCKNQIGFLQSHFFSEQKKEFKINIILY